MIKKTILISLFSLILIVAGFFYLFYLATIYYVEDYKSVGIVSNPLNKALLKERGQIYELKGFELWVEWYTYDNKNINKSPYKLLIGAREINTQNIYKIDISKISVKSNFKKNYYIKTELPVLLYPTAPNRNYKTVIFEPPLHFDFKKREKIYLEIHIDIKLEGKNKTIKFSDEYLPIEVKHSDRSIV